MRRRLTRVILLAMVVHAQPIPPQLWIRGDTSPYDFGKFNFQIDGNTVAYNLETGVAAGPYILTPGAHTITETGGAGTDLASYIATFGGDCTDGKGQGVITVAGGDTKTCVVSRLGPPTLNVNVYGSADESQARSGDVFNVQLDGATILTNIPVSKGAGSQQIVSPGRHRVTEVAGPGTTLANYTVLFFDDCAPDGTVTVPQDGKVRSCNIQNIPAYSFLFVSFAGPLGQSSGATLKLIAADNSAVLQTFTLKKPGDPAWTDTVVNQTLRLNSPLQAWDFYPVVSLIPASSDDTWQIEIANMSVSNDPNSTGTCVFELLLGSTHVLTQSAPDLSLHAGAPADLCANTSAPVLSPPPGSYTCPQTVTITEPTGWPIFVTTDGSWPTGRSNVYSNPLTISSTETISAIGLGYPSAHSTMTTGFYVCATPPVCPSGQHCCTDIKAGACTGGCINNNIACKPICSPGYKCCTGVLPTGACDSPCIPNSGHCK